MSTNDIVLSIMALMIFGMTIYVFGGAFIDIIKEKYSKKDYISWEELTDAKHVQ
jgi:hypothetical protein